MPTAATERQPIADNAPSTPHLTDYDRTHLTTYQRPQAAIPTRHAGDTTVTWRAPGGW